MTVPWWSIRCRRPCTAMHCWPIRHWMRCATSPLATVTTSQPARGAAAGRHRGSGRRLPTCGSTRAACAGAAVGTGRGHVRRRGAAGPLWHRFPGVPRPTGGHRVPATRWQQQRPRWPMGSALSTRWHYTKRAGLSACAPHTRWAAGAPISAVLPPGAPRLMSCEGASGTGRGRPSPGRHTHRRGGADPRAGGDRDSPMLQRLCNKWSRRRIPGDPLQPAVPGDAAQKALRRGRVRGSRRDHRGDRIRPSDGPH